MQLSYWIEREWHLQILAHQHKRTHCSARRANATPFRAFNENESTPTTGITSGQGYEHEEQLQIQTHTLVVIVPVQTYKLFVQERCDTAPYIQRTETHSRYCHWSVFEWHTRVRLRAHSAWNTNKVFKLRHTPPIQTHVLFVQQPHHDTIITYMERTSTQSRQRHYNACTQHIRVILQPHIASNTNNNYK